MNRQYLPWFALGFGCAIAYRLTIYQLESFKRQCEILPEESRETVDKATENALKLDTLVTLSRGVNYNLSRAAIRIIAERALTDTAFPTLLRHAISSTPSTRHTALKTLRFLILGKSKSENYYENDNDHILSKESELILYSQPVFHTLVHACLIALPRKIKDTETYTQRDEETEAYALECLRSLIRQPHQAGSSTSTLIRAINAGVVVYMKRLPSPGYPNIIAAFSDTEYQPTNYFLYDIHNWMLNHDDADDYLEALKKAELYVERPKVIMMGMRGGVGGTFERQVQEFHRTLRERYPTAVSVEEALEFAAAEGMTFENGEAVAGRGAVWQ
ncbi:hypothetical protein TWF569_010279 [Orbilia oligospora]|uniref:Uncharacterized protein n=1 Tax=Orbilia oligospora TaxID=2813651 RepID=A0A7C8P3G1_ORBOL|nr:hypothetical protein TWF102_003138 [Orbilia oligospora]KAF3113966.1 hypothetical protein TWF706_009318 [Orbilia oligospora]KAF3116720.1 hypothetical protein TWF103_008478 [Orbilia oligospora]KAF3128821.1 hypothetical protein TWF703_009196 [Orbilia oligospora]KAF3134081.1 hypothetical protein TWF569_010279 [Orbilia oligospora]